MESNYPFGISLTKVNDNELEETMKAVLTIVAAVRKSVDHFELVNTQSKINTKHLSDSRGSYD